MFKLMFGFVAGMLFSLITIALGVVGFVTTASLDDHAAPEDKHRSNQ